MQSASRQDDRRLASPQRPNPAQPEADRHQHVSWVSQPRVADGRRDGLGEAPKLARASFTEARRPSADNHALSQLLGLLDTYENLDPLQGELYRRARPTAGHHLAVHHHSSIGHEGARQVIPGV